MEYRNTVTGAVIKTASEIYGAHWERIKEAKRPPASPAKKRKQVSPDVGRR